MKFFDSHAHYDDECFNEDLEVVLKNAYDSGVIKIVDVGYNEETSRKAVEIANNHENIYAVVGNIPDERNDKFGDVEYIYELAKNPKVVAIGEIGLDYHYGEVDKTLQRSNFIKQIEIANELELPIVIHSRDADMDMLDVLKNHITPKYGMIFHCFSSSLEIAKEVLKLGAYISLSGSVTFKNARNLHEVAKHVPLDRLLIETDCPYMSPEPYRGQRNDSSRVILVAQKIADLKEISISIVAEATYNNAIKIYNIKE